jgi:hypothetical protein
MYKVSEAVRSTHSQDGAVVLNIQQDQMFTINLVGSRILELLKSGTSESDIVDDISRGFEVAREIAEKDVHEFIESLKQHRLVREG